MQDTTNKRKNGRNVGVILSASVAGFSLAFSNFQPQLVPYGILAAIVLFIISVSLNKTSVEEAKQRFAQIMTQGEAPREFRVEASLLRTLLTIGTIGGTNGTLIANPTSLSFVSSKGVTIFNEYLKNISYTNNTFPLTYFSVKTPTREYKLYIKAPYRGRWTSMYSSDIGKRIVELLDQYKSSSGSSSGPVQ